MKKYIVCGNYGASNLGDEAILDGIIDHIRKDHSDAEITVMSASPEETSRLHHVKSVPLFPSGFRSFLQAWRGNFGKTSRAVKAADIFMLGGGGLFTDEKFKAVIIWYLQARFALFFKKPLLCIGQSVGPLDTRLGRLLTKHIFKKALSVSVRDRSSAELLNQLGVLEVKVLPDFAFRLPCQVYSLQQRQSFVVISLRPWLTKEQKNQHLILAQFIDWMYEKYGFTTKLIPFQSFQEYDCQEFEKVTRHLKNPRCAEIISYTTDYRKTLELISVAHAVVGMRLHSLIFAMLAQTPFLALSYSQKVNGVVAEVGMEKFLLAWKSFSLEMLKNAIERLEDEREEIYERLRKI